MPTFGKRNSTAPDTYIFHNPKGKLRQERNSRHWTIENSRLKDVDFRLGRNLIRAVEGLKAKPNRPPVVAEWGCGNANALFELATKNPDKVFVGFSDTSHKEWEHKPKNVTLLHTTTRALERFAQGKSVKGKVDLIFTHFGLRHLGPSGFLEHITKLKETLEIGGKIMMSPVELKITQEKAYELGSELQKRGFEVEYQKYIDVSGTMRSGISALTRTK